MQRKTLLYLFIGISVALAAYLYYVDVDRKRSIEKYHANPMVGDIYKLKSNDDEGEQWLSYLKLVEVSGDRLVFIPGKLASNASADYLLNTYNTGSPVIYSIKELDDIRTGKWNTFERGNTVLVEIMRR